MARLVAALSGGVDSAVAAARALDAGHDVTGVHLRLLHDAAHEAAAGDAALVAAAMGLPFEVWDLSARFEASVIDAFTAEYSDGRTPNPCLRCNATIKFGTLLETAVARGWDGLVTGHYARLVGRDERAGTAAFPGDHAIELHRAADAAKDQSYVLAVLTKEQLRRSWFPLGASTKADVRAEAAGRGLPVATKPDSSDVCFIPGGDTAGWLRERLGPRPGPIVDGADTPLGRHDGTYRFTVGQRKGLRLRSPAPDGAPRYVVGLDPVSGVVTVGGHAAIRVDRLVCGPPTWCSGPPGRPDLAVQLRAHAAGLPALVYPDAATGRVDVALLAPAFGVAPGQTAVFYDGTRVVGSAVIDSTARDPV